MFRVCSLTIWIICLLCAVVALSANGRATQLEPSGFAPARGIGASGGNSTTLYDQTNACGGDSPASQQFPDFGDAVLQAADDFSVPPGQRWTIEKVFAQGNFFNPNPNNGPIDTVVVQVWDKSGPGGLPGSMLCEDTGANETTDPDIQFTLTNCAAIELLEGYYWVSVMGNMPFVPAGQLAWVVNDSTHGSEFAFRDPNGLTGHPCTTWGLGITNCGIGVIYTDLCFRLEGSRAESLRPVPTMTEWGMIIFMAVAGLAAVWVIMKRRKRAA